MHQQLSHMYEHPLEGTFLLKCDSHLPISGSIKVRGIYEVLKHAEMLALKHGLLKVNGVKYEGT